MNPLTTPYSGVVALVPTKTNSVTNLDSDSPDSTTSTSYTIAEHWQPILHASNQVVLYNPTSHALTIRQSSQFLERPCPYCKQKLPRGFRPPSRPHHAVGTAPEFANAYGGGDEDVGSEDEIASFSEMESIYNSDPTYHSRASDYFQLLAIANEASSRPPTPPLQQNQNQNQNSNIYEGHGAQQQPQQQRTQAFSADVMAEGYFKAFFQEEFKLGMGANGSVFLCQHVLDGNPLGHFAVKKIAVGESHSYLLSILREVRLLEQLHHPNIITYHHAWLETCQFSAFGLKVPTLHVLMQWAEGGSLDDLINSRLGRGKPQVQLDPLAPFAANSRFHQPGPSQTVGPTSPKEHMETHGGGDDQDLLSRSARIRAFRAMQRAPPEERERMRREMEELSGNAKQTGRPSWKAVHLLSAEEIKSLFTDVVRGLGFLHNKSILHLDLKPGNVLLTWDEGRLIPRAMLSDFGTSRDRISNNRTRSGNTGTLEYASPESLPSPESGLLQQIDSKADMWSLGMILHKLLFFKLPYRYAADSDNEGSRAGGGGEADKLDRLEQEILAYPGFKSTTPVVIVLEARRIPRTFLVLLEGLLHKVPISRPSCERVLSAERDGKFEPTKRAPSARSSSSEPNSLIPLIRRRSVDGPPPTLATIARPHVNDPDSLGAGSHARDHSIEVDSEEQEPGSSESEDASATDDENYYEEEDTEKEGEEELNLGTSVPESTTPKMKGSTPTQATFGEHTHDSKAKGGRRRRRRRATASGDETHIPRSKILLPPLLALPGPELAGGDGDGQRQWQWQLWFSRLCKPLRQELNAVTKNVGRWVRWLGTGEFEFGDRDRDTNEVREEEEDYLVETEELRRLVINGGVEPILTIPLRRAEKSALNRNRREPIGSAPAPASASGPSVASSPVLPPLREGKKTIREKAIHAIKKRKYRSRSANPPSSGQAAQTGGADTLGAIAAKGGSPRQIGISGEGPGIGTGIRLSSSPPPPPPPRPVAHARARMLLARARREKRMHRKIVWTRTVKACMLAAKILTIPLVCPSHLSAHPLISSLLVTLAIVDSLSDRMSFSFALLAAHVGVVVGLRTASGYVWGLPIPLSLLNESGVGIGGGGGVGGTDGWCWYCRGGVVWRGIV